MKLNFHDPGRYLKPIFCSVTLIGIHFIKPYLALLLDTETTHERHIQAFLILYNDFENVNLEKMMQADVINQGNVCVRVSTAVFQDITKKSSNC